MLINYLLLYISVIIGFCGILGLWGLDRICHRLEDIIEINKQIRDKDETNNNR